MPDIADVRRQFNWPSDDVIVAAQAGDQNALEALILGSHPHVARFAYTLCSTPEDAEEAAQEALTVLFRRVGTIRVTASLSSWLFQVVKNECIRRTRATIRSLTVQRELQTTTHTITEQTTEQTTEQLVIGRLEAQRVVAAMLQLPSTYRQVLVMRDIQSLSGHETAQRLGLSKAAMKSTLHRSRTMLRDLLEEPNPCD